MKRSEKILAFIQEKSRAYTKETLAGAVGQDAQEIADALGILRNNVSKELNELHREGRIVKFKGRPVRYFDKGTLEELLGVDLGPGPCQYEDVSECRGEEEEESNPFAQLIGAERSLSKQVEQAKSQEFVSSESDSFDVMKEINSYQEVSFKTAPKSVILSKFLESGNYKPEELGQAEAVSVEELGKKSISADDSLDTETLALVLEKQQKYDKAISVYEKLIAKYPEKSSTFAIRISELKMKLENNKK